MTSKPVTIIAASYDTKISVTDLLPNFSIANQKLLPTNLSQGNKILPLTNKRFLLAGNPAISLYDPPTNSLRHVMAFVGHNSNVSDICMDNQYMYSCSEDKTWKKWDLTKPRAINSVTTSSCLNTMAIIPDEEILMTGNDRGQVEVWNTSSGAQVAVQKVAQAIVRSIAFEPTSRTLVIGCQDGSVVISKLEPEYHLKEIQKIQAHNAILTRVAISPDGTMFATASADSTAKVFSLESGQEIATMADSSQTRWIWDVVFSSDSKTLYTCGTDKYIRIWSISGPKLLKAYTWHAKGMTAMTVME